MPAGLRINVYVSGLVRLSFVLSRSVARQARALSRRHICCMYANTTQQHEWTGILMFVCARGGGTHTHHTTRPQRLNAHHAFWKSLRIYLRCVVLNQHKHTSTQFAKLLCKKYVAKQPAHTRNFYCMFILLREVHWWEQRFRDSRESARILNLMLIQSGFGIQNWNNMVADIPDTDIR